MKLLSLNILFLLPFCLFAQKGILTPEVKQNTKNISPNLKTFIVENHLVACRNDSAKCYSIIENGKRKTLATNDILNFDFEDGYQYTIIVKTQLKPSPVAVDEDVYQYSVVKISSRKYIVDDIPVVTEDEIKSNIASNLTTDSIATTLSKPTETQNEKPSIFYTTKITPTTEIMSNDIEELKKQIIDLRKQLQVMQLQLDMQLKIIENKN